ncbi:unnamed protein product [Adineta ricciae]|uniref:SecA DEAD-like N-terminal domain-containing protein n=1 Tax=Adineta ricciae TaxID=249248 RepID=A0A815PRS8_ADIRI|nr:unnamed protein product [Adineta ricciae]
MVFEKNQNSHDRGVLPIKPFKGGEDEASSDEDDVDIGDISCMPHISIVKKKEEKIYQHLLPIDNGFYDGTLDKDLLREGLGTYSLNNGEEYYSGSWKLDRPNGYGYHIQNYGSTIYHGEFYEGKLKEGFGKVTLSNKYEYRGTVTDGQFHGLGFLSIKIAGLTDMDKPNEKKETLRLIAEWDMGKTKIIYVDEVKRYYHYHSESFYKTLESTLSSYNETLQEQKKYFEILLDIVEKHLNLSVLDEISIHADLPATLRSSANLLYALDESYTNLKKYTEIDTGPNYIERVKSACTRGLQTYARRLASTDDGDNRSGFSVRDIFDNKLSSFTKQSRLEDLIPVLSFDIFAIDLIKKLVNSVNERSVQILTENRPEFIEHHKNRIKSIWADYLECLANTNSSGERYQFYFDCYANLLKLSAGNEAKDKIELIIINAMTLVLENLKPWRVIDGNNIFHENTPIKKIGDDLIIGILRNTKSEMKGFFQNNADDFEEIFKSIIVHYENHLVNKLHPNYQNSIQEIIQINEYFIEISKTKNSPILTLQFETIKTYVHELTTYIDRFRNFNHQFRELSKKFSSLFPNQTKTRFDLIASEILRSIEDLLIKILATEPIITNRDEIVRKYSPPLENSLRQAAHDKLINDVVVLLDMGAKINDRSPSSGQTALHRAVENQDRNMILLLLKRGASRNIEDNDGRSPNYYAKQNNLDFEQIFLEGNDADKDTSVRLFALQKLNDFLANLLSLNLTWIVECKNIEASNQYIQPWTRFLFKIPGVRALHLSTAEPFEKYLFEIAGMKGLYSVIDIEKATSQVKTPHKHYTLETVRDFVDIVRTMNFPLRFDSSAVIRARADFITAISNSLKYLNDQVKYSSLEQFKEEFLSPFRRVTENIGCYEEFHKKLETIETYFVYERKLREITVEQALETFKRKNGALPGCDLVKKYFKNYEKYFKRYFYQIIERKSSSAIRDVISETKKNAKFDKNTIPQIIAGLSVIFSLGISDFIGKNSENQYVLKENFDKTCFLQPHCIQILGVFFLLNMNDEKNDSLLSGLAEITTGQGKSWVLALLAAYFSLIGYRVTVSCYSDYLTKRDSEYFRRYFEPFDLNKSVQYRTFKTMCEEQLVKKNEKKNLRNLISDILQGENLSPEVRNEAMKEKSILLIDEVDVFFSDEFGMPYKPGLRIPNRSLAKVQKDIWQKTFTRQKNIHKSSETELIKESSTDKFIATLNEFNMLNKHLKSMIDTAAEIYQDMNGTNELRNKYRIEGNNLQTRDANDKFVSTVWYGYENSFYYLKLMHEKHGRFHEEELNEENFGYFSIQCGLLSYSELPKTYHRIFGVSGSLQCLSAAERSLLEYYDIQQKEIFHIRANLGIDPYFATQNEIYVGENCESIDRERFIRDEYAGHHGKVTLLTRELGRGVDFQTEPIVNQNGGMHVIQTFFSENIREEIQIRGRTARKDEPGSYELIVCLQHLRNPGLSGMNTWKFTAVTKDTTYKELDRQRTEFVNKSCQEKIRTIEGNSGNHKRTLSFFQRAVSECNDRNRHEFINEIAKLQ